jgi:hypothetical protein
METTKYTRTGDSIILRINRGDEIVSAIRAVCNKEAILTGTLTGLGAACNAVIGYYDVDSKAYHSRLIKEAQEIVSLSGLITRVDNEVHVHAHIVLADGDCRCVGGHLNSAEVSATCEVVIRNIEATISRIKDDQTGLQILQMT